MQPLKAMTLGPCERIDVNNLAANATEAKAYARTVLLTCDVAVHIVLDDVATTDALLVPSTANPPLIINLAAGQAIRVLASADVGSAWLVEVR